MICRLAPAVLEGLLDHFQAHFFTNFCPSALGIFQDSLFPSGLTGCFLQFDEAKMLLRWELNFCFGPRVHSQDVAIRLHMPINANKVLKYSRFTC